MVAGRGALRGQLRGIVIVVALLTLLGGSLMGCAVGMIHYMERRDDVPADWAVELEALNPELMPNARETTEQTCVDDLPCRWAVTSDTAVVMMFDDQDDACRAADSLPATVRHDWLAVQFTPGALSVKQRADLLVHLDSYDLFLYDEEFDSLTWLPWMIGSCP